MILAHKIRLAPNNRQEAYFRRAAGAARFAWNWGLAEWRKAYSSGGRSSGYKLRKRFNAIRRSEFPWTYDVHRDCTSEPFRNLQKTLKSFFHKAKAGKNPAFPRFKKKGRCKDSFYLANDPCVFWVKGKEVKIPKIGIVRMQEPLRFEGKIMGATISRQADQWHIAIQVDVGDAPKVRIDDEVVGIDLGIKNSATLSTGEVVKGPKPLAKNLKRLQRLSHQLSRQQKGSKNREKTKLRFAKLHLRIANIRADHLHKLSSRLCSENQTIGIEDLNVQWLARNQHAAKAIRDEGWGKLRRQLEYKSELWGSQLVIHDRWFPSSKTCSSCGYVKDELLLSTRTYRCSVCGLVIDRDLNAALNLVPKDIGEVTPGKETLTHNKSCGDQSVSANQESSYHLSEWLMI